MPAKDAPEPTRQERLGAALKAHREELKKHDAKRWTQQAVADRLNVAQTYISALERGTMGKPGFRRLVEIAKAYDLDVNKLLVDSGWPDVSAYVAELQDLQDSLAGLSGVRAEIAQMLADFPEDAEDDLLTYARFLREERMGYEDVAQALPPGERGELVVLVSTKLPDEAVTHVLGLVKMMVPKGEDQPIAS